MTEMSIVEQNRRKHSAGELFSPRTPITTQELFSGRYSQIMKVCNAIGQSGAHAVLYGERGVGKTSLANIAPILYHINLGIPIEKLVSIRVNCDGTDTFDVLWRKVFRSIRIDEERWPIGFLASDERITHPLSDDLPREHLTPAIIKDFLVRLDGKFNIVLTFDEFDRLPAGEVPRLMADTIKSLSDSNVAVTLVIVGVGDSVSELVRGHESVGRHIVEVPLPRMSSDELEKIINDRLPKLEMTMDKNAIAMVCVLSSGLPYFTHLLGQHAVSNAIDERKIHITKKHVEAAMKKAIQDSEIGMTEAYYKATISRHPGSTFAVTLAACALTQEDDLGYFTAAQVREQLARIRGSLSAISDFIAHLNRFCDAEKSGILQSTGSKHQRRFRFRNPLMQPFVVIKSLDQRILDLNLIKASIE